MKRLSDEDQYRMWAIGLNVPGVPRPTDEGSKRKIAMMRKKIDAELAAQEVVKRKESEPEPEKKLSKSEVDALVHNKIMRYIAIAVAVVLGFLFLSWVSSQPDPQPGAGPDCSQMAEGGCN
jgi:hypothetical protein